MNEKPILFSGEMVRAIMEGRKTQTRRVIKPQPVDVDENGPYIQRLFKKKTPDFMFWNRKYITRKYETGERLWVRETWGDIEGHSGIYYRADDIKTNWMVDKWRPSIFMPRWASRITLEIVNVRVERVQDITHNDACLEGAPSDPGLNNRGTGSIYIDWFAELWDSINARRGYGWDANPWVWVIEFKPTPPSSD